MIYFLSDYSLGGHPKVMDALMKTNFIHTEGYQHDEFCSNCENLIRKIVNKPNCHVHFMAGGTPTNTILIASALRPFEGVICAETGHIYVHETGSVEAHGHRVFAAPSPDGKLTPSAIEKIMVLHEDEHCVRPGMIYITQPAENGAVYTKAELVALRESCDKNGLTLFVDGARLGCALTWPGNDLTIQDLADLTDAFYIGGTKIGALFGEALVIMNENINKDFRYMVKQGAALFARGRLMAIQMQALLEGKDGSANIEDSLYFELSRNENEMAIMLAKGLEEKGYKFAYKPQTNQLFPIMSKKKYAELQKDFVFYDWKEVDEDNLVVRFVTNWNTQPEEVQALIDAL